MVENLDTTSLEQTNQNAIKVRLFGPPLIKTLDISAIYSPMFNPSLNTRISQNYLGISYEKYNRLSNEIYFNTFLLSQDKERK